MSPLMFRGSHGRGGTDEFERSGSVRGDPAGDRTHHGAVRRCTVAERFGASSQTAGAHHPSKWSPRRNVRALGCSKQPADISSRMRPVCWPGAGRLPPAFPRPAEPAQASTPLRCAIRPIRLHQCRRCPCQPKARHAQRARGCQSSQSRCHPSARLHITCGRC